MCRLIMRLSNIFIFEKNMSVWSAKDDLNLWIKLCLLLKEIILYLYWNALTCKLEIWFYFGFLFALLKH